MTARLVLWRARPPFRKVVRVRRVTVAGFEAVIARVYERVSAATLARGGKPVGRDEFPFLFTAQDYFDFADVVCVDQPRSFFGAWMSRSLPRWLRRKRYRSLNQRNMEALLAASRGAEGPGKWSEMFDLVQPPAPGAKSQAAESGGIGTLVDAIALRYQMDPRIIYEEWAMQRFMSVCAGLRRTTAAAAAEPSSNQIRVQAGQKPLTRDDHLRAGMSMGRFAH